MQVKNIIIHREITETEETEIAETYICKKLV